MKSRKGLVVADVSSALSPGSVVLCTLSGKFGDIFWAMASARELNRRGAIVDFATMERFSAVKFLVASQPYVRGYIAMPECDWPYGNDSCGVQPWLPRRVSDAYDYVFHFTYRSRPHVPLIDYPGLLYGFSLSEPALPFIDVGPVENQDNLVAHAFNSMFRREKDELLERVRREFPMLIFEDVSGKPFLQSARVIKSARMFLGCRSANFVLAQAVRQRCLTFELESGRRGRIFSCPYGTEVMPDPEDTKSFIETIQKWCLN